MDPIRDEMLRNVAEAGDDLMRAMVAGLGALAGQLREIAASIQLCEPSDEGVMILTLAAEFLEQRVAAVQQHPELVREIAARRLRGAMRVIGDPLPTLSVAPPEAGQPLEAVWRLLSALALAASREVPGKRDHQALLRVVSIAERYMSAAARCAEGTRPRRPMSLVPNVSAEVSEPAGAGPDGGRSDDGAHA